METSHAKNRDSWLGKATLSFAENNPLCMYACLCPLWVLIDVCLCISLCRQTCGVDGIWLPCRTSVYQSLASHGKARVCVRASPCVVLKWTKSHWDRFFSAAFYFPCQYTSPLFHVHLQGAFTDRVEGSYRKRTTCTNCATHRQPLHGFSDKSRVSLRKSNKINLLYQLMLVIREVKSRSSISVKAIYVVWVTDLRSVRGLVPQRQSHPIRNNDNIWQC